MYNGKKFILFKWFQSEQRLVQDLINEQLKIYGIDVTYIPRKFVNQKSIIEEVQSSKFDDNFVYRNVC